MFMSYMNSYTYEFSKNITRFRNYDKLKIAIAVIVADETNAEQYEFARKTLTCYSQLNDYSLHIISLSRNCTLANNCSRHIDFMFRRHCILSHAMTEWTEDWILFADADMGIINPNHLIEDYLPKEDHIYLIFYQRIFNHEIMAGSFILKNNDFARKFLMDWANYEFKVPRSFHGTDNGAIQSVVADTVTRVGKTDREHRALCQHYWNISTGYDSLSLHEVCLQMYIADRNLEHIRILPKGRWPWARDGWLTDSQWSDKDFFLHGWQLRRRDKYIFGRWHSPLVDHNSWNCNTKEQASKAWRYKNSFYVADMVINDIISKRINDTALEFERYRTQLLSEIVAQ